VNQVGLYPGHNLVADLTLKGQCDIHVFAFTIYSWGVGIKKDPVFSQMKPMSGQSAVCRAAFVPQEVGENSPIIGLRHMNINPLFTQIVYQV
jgi:hypothetical protein